MSFRIAISRSTCMREGQVGKEEEGQRDKRKEEDSKENKGGTSETGEKKRLD